MGAFAALSGEPVTQNDNSIFSDNSDEDGSILDKQVEDLNLSVRSYNCLKRAGIHTVRQLLDFSEDDLLNIRNFGTKSIDEVKEKLEEMDMGLKNS
jgi:DNA-directed RNA polymerase subunit alpha